MKVEHIVSSTSDEVDSLFNMAMTACLMVYPTVEEQSAAILSAKTEFQIQLDSLLCQAYKLGKKIDKVKADQKDTSMYVAP